MKNQAYRMTMLYDFYGDLLTDRQKEFYDLYYNEDFSLAEIAENYGITRQGVRDIIVRAEGTLTEIEEKTGFIRRFHTRQSTLSQVEGLLARMDDLNHAQFHSEELAVLRVQLQEAVEALRKE